MIYNELVITFQDSNRAILKQISVPAESWMTSLSTVECPRVVITLVSTQQVGSVEIPPGAFR
jgi:hypothetical protein